MGAPPESVRVRVYIAASFRRQTEMRRVRDDLALIGIGCTSRWLDVDEWESGH